MNGVVYGMLMEMAYEYRSPGYKDWPKYADEISFKNGLTDYLKPSQDDFLMQSGVNVPDIIFSMLGKEG